MSDEVGSGWFVCFNAEEKETENDLIEYLKEGDYPEGAEGIKKLLMDCIYEDEEESDDEGRATQSQASPILETLRNNPEAVAQTAATLLNFGKKMLNAKVFKK